MITVKVVNNFDSADLKRIAETIFSSYDGAVENWDYSGLDGFVPLKKGNRSALIAVDDSVCVKFFYDKSVKSKIRDFLGFSKARKTFEIGLKVSQLGIQIPQLYGFSKKKFSHGIVFSKFEPDYNTIYWFVRGNPEVHIWGQLGQFIRSIHDKSVTHKDLAPKNIMVKQSEEKCEFLLLDYEDCKVNSQMTDELRLKDLHHFYERLYQFTTEEQRECFVKGYVAEEKAFCNYHTQLLKMVTDRPSKYTQ